VANVLAGAAGGLVGFHALSLTALAHRMGAASRWVGAWAAGVCAVALIFGSSVLSLAPRPVLGGVVVFLGLGFLYEWTYDAWFRLPRADHVVVLLILISIATLGLLVGVGVGIGLAVVLFVVDYSRTDVAKHTLSGATFVSRTERSRPERDVLRERGDQMTILELQGFIFFGTANGLLERIRHRGGRAEAARLRFLILDFRRVTGIDSSATLSFAKVQKLAAAFGFHLICAALPPNVQSQLERIGLRDGETNVRIFRDLDHAVERCENQILTEAGSMGMESRSLVASVSQGLDSPAQAERFIGHLERLELPAGHALIRQGEGTGDIYFVESGHVTAVLSRRQGEDIRLRSMGPGTIVGEVAMYLGSVRASVVAETPVTVYRLSKEDLDEIEEGDPRLAASLHRLLATLLAERLADKLATVEALSTEAC
jgi:SulP family sulfate permease